MLSRSLFFVALILLVSSLFLPFLANPPLSWLSGLLYALYDTWLIAFVAYQVTSYLRLLKRSRPESLVTKKKPSLSVVVPFRNEGVLLRPCLHSLLGQSDQAQQILFVDDGSTDQSLQVLKEELQLQWQDPLWRSQKYPQITVLVKFHSGKARSLNQALAHVTGQIFLTLDADTLLEPTALKYIFAAFAEDPFLRATGGVLRPVCESTWQGRLLEVFQKFEYIRAFLTRQAWTCKDSLLLVSGAFAAYDTDLVRTVGGFDPLSLVEDYELIHRLYHHAYENQIPIHVGVVPQARAVTDSPDSLKKFLQQRQRWFGGFLQTLFKYRHMLGQSRYQRLGTMMLPIKSLDTLQPLYGLAALYALVSIFILKKEIPNFIWAVLLIKIIIDYIYHFYCLRLYNRWQQQKVPLSFWFQSFLVTLGEPLFFQPLRHLGAALGWWIFFRKRHEWLGNLENAPAAKGLPESP